VKGEDVGSGRKKGWGELSPVGRAAVVVLGAVQLALQAATLWDLRRRSDQELRGSRRWWAAASFVNVVGPVAYLAFGRRPR
jgi:hypothetical protein